MGIEHLKSLPFEVEGKKQKNIGWFYSELQTAAALKKHQNFNFARSNPHMHMHCALRISGRNF